MDFGQKWKNIQCHLDQFEAQWQPWGRPSWGRLAIQMRRRCFDLGQFFSPSKPLTHTHSHPLGKAQHFQSLSWIWFLQNADGKYLFVWCFQVGCLGGLCHLWTNHAWPHSQVSNIQIYFMIIKLSSKSAFKKYDYDPDGSYLSNFTDISVISLWSTNKL